MTKSLSELFSTPSNASAAKALWFGFAAMLLTTSPNHSGYPASYLRSVIEQAISNRCMKFYFNAQGEALGYVVWAFLAPDVEARFMKDGHWNLHPSEWDEGDSLWIIDIVAPAGNFREVIRDLRDVVFKNQQSVNYCRVRRGQRVRKKLSRDVPGHLFLTVDEKSPSTD